MTPADRTPLLEVRHLRKHFPIRRGIFGRVRGTVRAVDGVSFSIHAGETLGLVGESGCGKTTLGRLILRLLPPTEGSVWFQGRSVFDLPERELRKLRQEMQVVFQDPESALNPRMTVGSIVGEALIVHGRVRGAAEAREVVADLLERVGLSPRQLDRYPHEFSSGQRQRIGIARALALRPRFVVCDEAVSALDVSVQAQILNLLMDLREELDLSYLFIAHDLAVVRHVADRIAVMYLGRLVETGEAAQLFAEPAHPYTRALLSAIPRPEPGHRARRCTVAGGAPSPIAPPLGCRFHPRCPDVMPRCREEDPPAFQLTPRRVAWCWLHEGRAPLAGTEV